MPITRRYAALLLLASGSLLFRPAQAGNSGPQFTLSLDGLGQGLIASPFLSSRAYGAGGQAFLDWRPIYRISFGLGGQFATFFPSSSFQMESFDLGGRIFPLSPSLTPGGELYLQGGMGLNLLVKSPAPGHYHGYAGLGWRQFLGKDLALDLGAQYDFYSPIAYSSHGAAAKLGLTLLFGRDDWSEEPAGVNQPRARLLEMAAHWDGPSTYVLRAGESLRQAALRLYGDEALFPLLVDANRDRLVIAGRWADRELRVPRPPATGVELDRVEYAASNQAEYLNWEDASEGGYVEVHNPPSGSYLWRSGDDLPSVAARLYGDEDLFPLLVDANQDRLILPVGLVPGRSLRVPKLPAAGRLEAIRLSSHENPLYLRWRNESIEQRREKGRAPNLERSGNRRY